MTNVIQFLGLGLGSCKQKQQRQSKCTKLTWRSVKKSLYNDRDNGSNKAAVPPVLTAPVNLHLSHFTLSVHRQHFLHLATVPSGRWLAVEDFMDLLSQPGFPSLNSAQSSHAM